MYFKSDYVKWEVGNSIQLYFFCINNVEDYEQCVISSVF